MNSIVNASFFCSWSGGKDSCLALYKAIQMGGKPSYLLTMMTEQGERSRSHGLSIALLQRQSQALGIPLVTRPTSWGDYEANFISALQEFSQKGITHGVYGDIDIEAHRQWCQRVSSAADLETYHPIWQRDRRDLLNELVALKFKAVIVAAKDGVMNRSFLGKTIDPGLIDELEHMGIDASGETGEYHTVVVDGPLFSSPIHLDLHEQTFHDGYWFLNVSASVPF